MPRATAATDAPHLTLAVTPAPPRPPRAAVARLGGDELVLFERPAFPVPLSPERPLHRRRFDALRVVHACYAPEPSRDRWLQGVLEALRHLAPIAAWFEWSEAGEPDDPAAPAARPGRRAVAAVEAVLGRECYRALLRPPPAVQLLSHRLRALPPDLERRAAAVLRAHGLADALLVLAGDDASGSPVAVGMIAPDRPPSRTVGLLRHVAGHLGTARLLRTWFERRPVVPDARSIAPRAVAALLAAGAFAPVDCDEEARRWMAFLSGAYALVDHWPADGRRRVLVRRCHAAGDPAALRPAQTALLAQLAAGRSPDELRARLALSAAGVALHVSSACARLRCASRDDLAALLSA